MEVFRFLLVASAMSAYITYSEIVYPRIIEERSDSGFLTVKITEQIILVLQKASATLSRVRVDTVKKRLVRHEVINGSTLDEELYIDSAHGAVLMVHRIDGGVELTGMISERKRIYPMLESSRTLLHLAGPHKVETIHRTVVKDSSSNNVNNISRDVFIEGRAPTYEASGIVYPEVFVAVDSSYGVGASNERLLRYLIIFLAGVNIKLESLMMPRVQLRLAGFTRGEAMDRSMQVFYNHVDASLTLQQFHLQVSRYQFGNPDIFLLLTGHDLIGLVNGRYDPRLSGFSPVGGMCVPGQNALISEDIYLSYSGLDVTAHEFGHMLGAPHDVYPQPYDQTCGWDLGYIMSYRDGGLRRHYFSPCSQSLIRTSLSSKLPSCLALNFVHDYLTQIPGVYPGNEFNGNFFCKAMHRQTPNIYFPEQLPNTLLQCRLTCNEPQGFNGAYKYYTHHALDGTPCHIQNPKAVCKRGQCVQL